MLTISCDMCNKKINAPNPDGEAEHFWNVNVNGSKESVVIQRNFCDPCKENFDAWIDTYSSSVPQAAKVTDVPA